MCRIQPSDAAHPRGLYMTYIPPSRYLTLGVGKVVEALIGVTKGDEIRDLRERFSCK